MNDSRISNWAVIWVKNAGTAERLRVFCNRDDRRWPAIATAYWRGELSGLQQDRHSRSSLVDFTRLPGDERIIYFKRYLFRNGRDRWKHFVRRSRAMRELLAGEECHIRAFNTPRPLCAFEIYRRGIIRQSVLVTEAVPADKDAREWVNDPQLGVAGDMTERRKFISALAAEIARWHTAGLYHGDLRIGNIFTRRQDEGYIFYWLDNERTRAYRKLPARRRAHNLMQVNMDRFRISRTDRMRFWAVYRDKAGLPEHKRKALLRRFVRHTRRRWKKRNWI